jgi:hypothetical protein
MGGIKSMNAELTEVRPRDVSPVSVQDTLQTKRMIKQIMESVMLKEVHYGVIPGCKQPSLYKAGSEVLLSTFHISVEPMVEEFISRDERGRVTEVRYRVKCVGRHSPTGTTVGFGVGECSTGEDKYAWRRAICLEEFDAADETLRRIKWGKWNNKVQKTEQVRVSPSDVQNTVLKMAKKRAQIDLTLTALGCSDIFAQDLEDLDENLRENFTSSQAEPAMTALATEWVAKANAAPTAEDLETVWKAGVKAINEAKDLVASNAFKAAVTARGTALKAAAPAKSASVPDVLAGLIADMESAADGGPEAFDAAWGSLSKATKASLEGYYDALVARAAAAGGQS